MRSPSLGAITMTAERLQTESTAAATATLRLFDPTATEPPENAEPALRLPEAFEQFVLPRLKMRGAAAGTIKEYWTAIRNWEGRIVYPEVAQITPDHCLSLQESMRQPYSDRASRRQFPEGASAGTINKTGRHLRRIFLSLAKQKKIAEPPEFEIVYGSPVNPPRYVTLDEYVRLYLACEGHPEMRTCPTLEASDVWRTALVLLWFYGIRPSDLYELRWSQVTWTPAHPNPRKPYLNELGWIQYTTEKTGEPIFMPITEPVLRHLKRMRPEEFSAGDKVLPTPNEKNSQPHWQRITSLAGVDVGHQDLRFTCGENWALHGEALSGFVLGHAPQGVTNKHYRDFTPQLLRSLPNFEFPDCFRLPSSAQRQRPLFR